MYHPSRGGVRGGRDQFTWDDVKADKHRENYLGHSVKAPVGRWQKGKDLFWYARDRKSQDANKEAMKEEIRRIKEGEEQAMREALGLAPKRAAKPQGSRLDKHEFSELVKRSSTAEDLGAGHEEAAWVHGIGFQRLRCSGEELNLPASPKVDSFQQLDAPISISSARNDEKASGDESDRKRRKHEDKRHGRHEKRDPHAKRDKRHSRDSDDKWKHKKDKGKRSRDFD